MIYWHKKLQTQSLYKNCCINVYIHDIYGILYVLKQSGWNTILIFSQKYFDASLYPNNAHFLWTPLTTHCLQLSVRRFSAGLCSNLLLGCNVVLVDDLRNFRKDASTIAPLNPYVSSFSPLVMISHTVYFRKHYWKKHLTQI